MTNKIGSVVLLLSCIFISLGFRLFFQNKMAFEGYTENIPQITTLISSNDTIMKNSKN
jgi:hypothetical protein